MNKYKFVFESAKEFLNKMFDEYKPNSTLEEHLKSETEFKKISDANLRLIKSLANTGRMSNVIGFDRKEKEIKPILFGYDPNKILTAYKDADELLKVFKNKFNLLDTQNRRNSWRKFSRGIISGSVFLASFKNKDDFDNFVKNFSYNKYTKAALPMLLSKEIHGFGFALSCDFLKEIDYRDYPKPDVMLIDIFYGLGLSKSKEDYEVYKSIIEMVEVVKKDDHTVDAYTVDKIFWLIGSGKLELKGNNKDKIFGKDNRKKFIESTKIKWNQQIKKKTKTG